MQKLELPMVEGNSMANLISGAQMLVECLVKEGVDCMFGYPGGVTLPFYDVLYEHQIRHVLVRHEQNAAFAAEGWARSTGRVGVCCATSGPKAISEIPRWRCRHCLCTNRRSPYPCERPCWTAAPSDLVGSNRWLLGTAGRRNRCCRCWPEGRRWPGLP